MLKNLIKACAASLLLATPLLGADVNGVFKGEGSKGPVVLQLQPGPQGYLAGKLECDHKEFAVVAKQAGDHVIGLVGAPGFQPVQFAGTIQENGSLTVTCNGSTIQLDRDQPAAGKADPSDPAADFMATANAAAKEREATQARLYIAQNGQPDGTNADSGDPVVAQYTAMANAAAKERTAMQAKMYNSQNNLPTATDQAGPAAYRAYGQTPVQTNSGYYGGNYQTGGNYPVQQTQADPRSSAGYNYPAPYTPMPAQQPAVNYNQPNDGSASMQQYEQYQAAQDQMSLQRSDAMREQNRYVGEDGTQYIAPETATQVTVDQGGQATYTTEQAPAAPANETVAQPYSYTAPVSTTTEGDGN